MNPLETSLTEKTGAEDTASETLIRGIFPIVIYCGGYSAGAPPLPIPNREVKPGRADGTAPPGGRVGRCRFLQEEADCTGFRVFSLLSFYPAPLLLSSVTARPGTPGMLSGHFRSRCALYREIKRETERGRDEDNEIRFYPPFLWLVLLLGRWNVFEAFAP